MNFLILLFLLLFTINAYTIEKKNVPALTMEQIANATLFIDFNGDANKQKIKLKKGHYEKRKQGSDTLSIDLTTWMKFTDLDKDGSEDAAVIYVWSMGGEEIFYELAAFVNIKGKAKHLTSIGLGDRVVIKSLEMQGDTVQLDMLTHGKGDENCCPTVPVKVRYNLQDGKLMEQKIVSPLALEDLKNATYTLTDYKGTRFVKLVDGKFKQSKWPPEPEYPASMYLREWIRFADLNSDGADDAVAIYNWDGGGSGIFYELAVVLNENGEPDHVSSAVLGDRVKINSLEIHGNTVLLDMVTHDWRHDANCCPSLGVKLIYKFQDGKLIEQSDFIGTYEGKATNKDSVEIHINMVINTDSSVNVIIQYSEGRPVVNKQGKWYHSDDGSLDVSLGIDDSIIFRWLNNKLTAVSHWGSTFERLDWEFEKVSK